MSLLARLREPAEQNRIDRESIAVSGLEDAQPAAQDRIQRLPARVHELRRKLSTFPALSYSLTARSSYLLWK